MPRLPPTPREGACSECCCANSAKSRPSSRTWKRSSRAVPSSADDELPQPGPCEAVVVGGEVLGQARLGQVVAEPGDEQVAFDGGLEVLGRQSFTG